MNFEFMTIDTPFSSSCPLDSIASSIRQYMTFAVLLTGNPVNALGKGIQSGNGVSIVINSKFILCVPCLLYTSRCV